MNDRWSGGICGRSRWAPTRFPFFIGRDLDEYPLQGGDSSQLKSFFDNGHQYLPYKRSV